MYGICVVTIPMKSHSNIAKEFQSHEGLVMSSPYKSSTQGS